MPENNDQLNARITCNTLHEIDFIQDPGSFNANDLSVWSFNIQELLQFIPSLLPWLNADEVERSRKYFKEQDRQRFITSRGMLRLLIGKYINKNPGELEFEIGRNKKPCLKGYDGLHYNMTHSGDLFLVGVYQQELGIDVEAIDTQFKFMEIIHSTFNEDEKTYIHGQADARMNFYKLWTRKEALLKGANKGINDEIVKIPLLDGTVEVSSRLLGTQKDWIVCSFELEEGYMAAVAYPDGMPVEDIKFFQGGPRLLSELF